MASNDALLSYLDEYEKNINQDNEQTELPTEKEIAKKALEPEKNDNSEENNLNDKVSVGALVEKTSKQKNKPAKEKLNTHKHNVKNVRAAKQKAISNETNSGNTTRTLIFNIHDVSEEEKEREAIQNELVKLDELLFVEDNERLKVSEKEQNIAAATSNNSIDDFLAKSKEIWESKQESTSKNSTNKKETVHSITVNAVADSSIDKFLAETRAEWARSGQTTTTPINNPAPNISTPTIDERRVSYKLDKGASVTDLMQQAETHHHEKWLETYEKAQRSRKDNEQARKLRAGRFRYNKDGELEFLPDVRIDDKSADDLLEVKWI